MRIFDIPKALFFKLLSLNVACLSSAQFYQLCSIVSAVLTEHVCSIVALASTNAMQIDPFQSHAGFDLASGALLVCCSEEGSQDSRPLHVHRGHGKALHGPDSGQQGHVRLIPSFTY